MENLYNKELKIESGEDSQWGISKSINIWEASQRWALLNMTMTSPEA
jgi:hypothetical protein